MKEMLFLLRTRSYHKFYVLANSANDAYVILKRLLDRRKFLDEKSRKIITIEILGEYVDINHDFDDKVLFESPFIEQD